MFYTSDFEIDYFIGGAAVEPATAAQHYSKRLILLPGLGQSYIRPPYQPQYLPSATHPLAINCSWYAQKVNPPLLQLLRTILSQTQCPLLREYVEKALQLVEDDDYRQQLSRKLRQMDGDQLLCHGSEKKFFRHAIDDLIANHDALTNLLPVILS